MCKVALAFYLHLRDNLYRPIQASSLLNYDVLKKCGETPDRKENTNFAGARWAITRFITKTILRNFVKTYSFHYAVFTPRKSEKYMNFNQVTDDSNDKIQTVWKIHKRDMTV